MNNCKKCGAEVSEGAKFCGECGAKIEFEESNHEDEIDGTTHIDEENVSPKKPLTLKEKIIVACATLLAIYCVTMGVVEAVKDNKKEGESEEIETEQESSNEKGSKNNPYILNADTWHAKHCAGTSQTHYIDKWVKVTGTVLSISDYGSLKGYYLSGGPGSGLVCWVEGGSLTAQYGQKIEYIGKVTVEDSKQVEISDGQIKSASWPTNKPKSPITISNWTWERDYAGGVEWNFQFNNNTNKVVKYITMEWNCYNAVGDLVYDEITGKCSHGVKFTGPLEVGQTSDLLCNTNLFYNYSYQSSKLTKLTVEFMDGTIIYISSKGYTDILAEN